MKKTSLLVIVGCALASYQCLALDVNVTRNAGYVGAVPQEAEGGEFNVIAVNPADPVFQSILLNYTANTIVNGGFETFCADVTVEGGGNPEGATFSQNGVSEGVAYLYYEFAKGTLANYDYTPGGSAGPGGVGSTGRAGSAFALQNAIWQLEGQESDTAAGSYYYNLAINYFGGGVAGLAEALSAANGDFGVDELLLTYPADGRTFVQPLLVLVPDGGATVILLGMALGGFCLFSRKLRHA